MKQIIAVCYPEECFRYNVFTANVHIVLNSCPRDAHYIVLNIIILVVLISIAVVQAITMIIMFKSTTHNIANVLDLK